jgi:hypothetical protein
MSNNAIAEPLPGMYAPAVDFEQFGIRYDLMRPNDYEVEAAHGVHVFRAQIKIVSGRPVVIALGAERRSEGPDIGSFTAERKAEGREVVQISLRDFKRLPFATFEAAARAAVTHFIRHDGPRSGEQMLKASEMDWQLDLSKVIREAKPTSRRRSVARGSLDRIELAKKYQELVDRGERYPGAKLADALGVPANVIRQQVFRLRKEGRLPPANEERR